MQLSRCSFDEAVRVATHPGFVPWCPASQQDQPPDAKCPGFQGKVKMTKIITTVTTGVA